MKSGYGNNNTSKYTGLKVHIFKTVVGHKNSICKYRIYSIKRPGRLLNFWTLRVGAYSRWALNRGWALIKFSPFLASSKFSFQENNV